MDSIKIIGSGIYLPEKIITNDDYTKILDTSDEWIRVRTGIKERRVSSGEPTWLMSFNAAQSAIENAGIAPDDIDMIIHVSVTPDYFTPSIACILQGKLGLPNAFGIDINCACAGFIYAIDMARRYIATGCKTVLIAAGDNLTRLGNFTDRSTCVLFGDGASACVVQGTKGLYGSHMANEGEGAKHIFARSIPPQNAFSPPSDLRKYDGFAECEDYKIHMDGREVYKFATRVLPLLIEKSCENAGITVNDLDLIVPHQANYRIMETAAQKLNLPMDKLFINIEKYGNTSGVSVGLCLDELIKSGKLKRGDKICCAGFGAGLTYGAVVFEY